MEYKNNLPHFDHIGMTFFITFRLFNSIETQKATTLKEERKKAVEAINKKWSKEEQRLARNKIEQRYFAQYDGLLDHATHGDRFLMEEPCLQILKDAIHQFDGTFYRLEAYCIMPNHVHLVIDTSTQIPGDQYFDTTVNEYKYIKDIMHRIKGKSARLINLARNTTGSTVWLSENYDRYIRNESHYQYALNYTINNPVKAGLVERWEDWAGNYLRKVD
jgi:putative transposase